MSQKAHNLTHLAIAVSRYCVYLWFSNCALAGLEKASQAAGPLNLELPLSLG